MSALRTLSAFSAAPVLALLLAACGGGGGSLAEGGIGGTGVTSTGTVTGFGSVYVNGVRYETDGGTTIVANGDTFDGTDDRTVLAVGMVVRVEGTVNSDGVTGTADRIVYDSSLRGPFAVAPAPADPTSSFAVLGQVVHVSPTTIFSGTGAADTPVTGLASMTAGDLVEVSGFRAAGGEFYATRVAVDGGWTGETVEVEDAVATISETVLTLASGLQVDISGIGVGTTLAPGQFVEVEGTYDGSRIIASSIELKDDLLGGDDGDEVELEGVITAVDGTLLTVNGVRVQAPAGSTFTVGQRVEAEGVLQNGVLVAEEIELKAESEFEFKGEVLAVDSLSSTQGTVRLFDLAIAVTADTIIDDKARFFDPETGVRVGDLLCVHAGMGVDGLVATEISFEDGSEQSIEGPIGSIDPVLQHIVIGGVTVVVAAVPDDLSGLTEDQEVEFIGSWDAGLFIATELDSD